MLNYKSLLITVFVLFQFSAYSQKCYHIDSIANYNIDIEQLNGEYLDYLSIEDKEKVLGISSDDFNIDVVYGYLDKLKKFTKYKEHNWKVNLMKVELFINTDGTIDYFLYNMERNFKKKYYKADTEFLKLFFEQNHKADIKLRKKVRYKTSLLNLHQWAG